jgi:hypothetical protein
MSLQSLYVVRLNPPPGVPMSWQVGRPHLESMIDLIAVVYVTVESHTKASVGITTALSLVQPATRNTHKKTTSRIFISL